MRTAIVGLALLATGCGVRGLNFIQDTRVVVTAPAERSQVVLPVTLRWEASDFVVTGPTAEATPDAGYFAIFVDRAPQPPGETLDWLARDDRSCVREQGCPDEEWLAQYGTYVTTSTSFTLDRMPARQEEHRREFHEVTIVLLDGAGQRIGESAWSVEFEVVRDS